MVIISKSVICSMDSSYLIVFISLWIYRYITKSHIILVAKTLSSKKIVCFASRIVFLRVFGKNVRIPTTTK